MLSRSGGHGGMQGSCIGPYPGLGALGSATGGPGTAPPWALKSEMRSRSRSALACG